MKIISYNIICLPNPYKTLGIQCLIPSLFPEVILMQEIMLDGPKVVAALCSLFLSLSFHYTKSCGKLLGLFTSWFNTNILCSLAWTCHFFLVNSFSHNISDLSFVCANVYRPYVDQKPYQKNFFKLPCFDVENTVVGGDLNFTISHFEILEPSTQLECLAYLFMEFVDLARLAKPLLIKFLHTWSNKRMRDDYVEK